MTSHVTIPKIPAEYMSTAASLGVQQRLGIASQGNKTPQSELQVIRLGMDVLLSLDLASQSLTLMCD